MLVDYNIDFTMLINQYLASFKRRVIRVKWIAAITTHLKTIHTEFITDFNAIKNEMKWDGRTILLERFLQIKFAVPGIQIINNDLSGNPFIGYPCPNTSNPIGFAANDPESPIGGSADQAIELYGFKIQVPIGSVYDPNELKATVNQYLIGGSDFEIIEI